MLLSLRKNGLTSLFKEVSGFSRFSPSPFGFRRFIVSSDISCVSLKHFGTPGLGSAERGHPNLFRFPRFLRFVPIWAPCFGNTPICSDLFRFLPICSVFFRFVFRTNQNTSGKPLSADPFCKSPNTVDFLGAPKDLCQQHNVYRLGNHQDMWALFK